MFYTYALYNQSKNKIYIGQTSNLEIRLKHHNGELTNKKTSYTARNRGEWIVVHKEVFETRSNALIREKQLKAQKGREFIWNIAKTMVAVVQR